jgi:PAS domain S-box-containing protein
MDLKFYQALESAINDHSIVIITDVEGTITFVNKKAQEITGYTEAELIGANHRVINSGVHPIEFWKEMYRTIGRKETWHDKVCNRAKDGHLY